MTTRVPEALFDELAELELIKSAPAIGSGS